MEFVFLFFSSWAGPDNLLLHWPYMVVTIKLAIINNVMQNSCHIHACGLSLTHASAQIFNTAAIFSKLWRQSHYQHIMDEWMTITVLGGKNVNN
jgi:hypothetical protein